MRKTKASRQTAAALEATLAALEAKRAELVARGAELPEVRRGAAFAAHVEGSEQARLTLDLVSAELAAHSSELASIDDAIASARNKLSIAQAIEATAADHARAREALEILVEFKKAGCEMDAALRTVAERGAVLQELLHQIHRTSGSAYPTTEQLGTLGYAAVMTALLRTPWAKRFRPLQPFQRREFGDLFSDWCSVIEHRLQPLLTDTKEAA